MKRYASLLLLIVLLAALPAAGHAQGGTPANQSGPAQIPSVCQAALADSQVNAGLATTPWREFRAARQLSTDTTFSPPQALSMISDSDGSPASGPDLDAVGQVITFTQGFNELAGALSYFYTPGPNAANTELRVQLYELANNSLGTLITTASVLTNTAMLTNSWQFLEWDVSDPTTISRLDTLGRAALVFTWASTSSASGDHIWLDDLSADVCVAAARLSGKVTQGGNGIEAAPVLLAYTNAAGHTSVLANTRTAADGSYRFLAVPALAAGESYQIWFRQPAQSPPAPNGMLGFWAGPQLNTLATGQLIDNLNFNVEGVTLLSPRSYDQVVVTPGQSVVLSWSGRTTGGEYHRACLYDPERADPLTRLPLTFCSPPITPIPNQPLSFSLDPTTLPVSFGFTYGRSYRWYVAVYDRNPSDPQAQYGYSFAERALTLYAAPRPMLFKRLPLDTAYPVEGLPNAEWTLLIYIAADNALGKPNQGLNLSQPAMQLADLPKLASTYTRVNLVSYVDYYHPDGAQLCFYPPAALPDCKLRPETNTADPLTLTDFITYGRQHYPADHTALLIVAPGQAAGQLALDETTPDSPALSLAGLNKAYEDAKLGSAAKLDLIIYQVPLFGSAEVVRATAPYARYMVASPGDVWQLSAYTQLVPVLAGAQRFDLAAVARDTVNAYGTTTERVLPRRALTWAAYDLGRVEAMNQALDTLAAQLEIALSSDQRVMREALTLARATTQAYTATGTLDGPGLSGGAGPLAQDSLLDLHELTRAIRDAVGVPDYVREAADQLLTLLDTPASNPVIASFIRSDAPNLSNALDLSQAHGLGIFFPSGDRLGDSATLAVSYQSSDPPALTRWAAMLRTYQEGMLPLGPGGVTQSVGGATQFRPLPGRFVRITLYLPLVAR